MKVQETKYLFYRKRKQANASEIANQGNVTLPNVNVDGQESLGETYTGPQLSESSQVSNEIQAWTKIFEQRNSDGITKKERRNRKQARCYLE